MKTLRLLLTLFAGASSLLASPPAGKTQQLSSPDQVPDGKVILGGFFNSVLGVARSNMTRLHADGTLDAGFNASANNQVFSLAVQADGRVLIGGIFTTVAGQSRVPLARNPRLLCREQQHLHPPPQLRIPPSRHLVYHFSGFSLMGESLACSTRMPSHLCTS